VRHGSGEDRRAIPHGRLTMSTVRARISRSVEASSDTRTPAPGGGASEIVRSKGRGVAPSEDASCGHGSGEGPARSQGAEGTCGCGLLFECRMMMDLSGWCANPVW
jgi:hypothetical protein